MCRKVSTTAQTVVSLIVLIVESFFMIEIPEIPQAPELRENPLLTELRNIRAEIQANKIAWACLVEELYHNGQVNQQSLQNRIDGNMWMDCKDELAVYSDFAQYLHNTAKEVEQTIHQDNSNMQGVVNSPNSNISNSFNK